MTIELYVFPPSPRAFKVMAVANHLGIDWTVRLIDLAQGEQQSPEFAALNPNMRMPVLKDGNYGALHHPRRRRQRRLRHDRNRVVGACQ